MRNPSNPSFRWAFIVASTTWVGCERHAVDMDLPTSGRALSNVERKELQKIADATFREVRAGLPGLPERITLIVRC